ncbi:stage V sporulation protein E [Paenibacillus wynnii]|uniref:Stage V sporulation protein E n=1 Tax=Paenibacillus wynnii TaxID=268407 RepID=A0A098M6B2_9BACL|nr:stage V sporulation protein E [Paenibacillus wynnii]KGE18109.1 stage V sporulation protein E [Paenibacillus wynnii]
MNKSRPAPDLWLLIPILSLLAIGMVMVYSAGSVLGFRNYGDSFYFVKRQLLFAGLGLAAMFITTNTDYRVWKSFAKSGLILCFILLILVLIPGIGVVRGGARSWLGISSFGIQPSEFMKMGMILYLANWLGREDYDISSFTRGLLPPLALIGSAFGLIMLQPDLGTGTVMMGAALMMVYTAGAKIKHLLSLGIAGVAGFIVLIATAPYRLQRITAFLDPWSDPLGAGYQIIQSLYAIGPGGLGGLGLGMSRQKYSYVPEPQTDFIFSILAEELGFIGGLAVLALFLIIVWRGMKVAMSLPDRFGSYLAVGIVCMVAVQVVINIGVVIGMMPVTGITLPLISYGGSSLTLMLTALGILLNLSRYVR